MSELAATGSTQARARRSIASDDRLARRATKGDRRAFAAIYRRYHQDIYRFCLAIVGNPQDAQDALQNTMVKVLGALPGETREIKLKPWLYRIAHNESIEVVRRRRPVEEIAEDHAAAGPGLAEEAALRDRLRRLMSDMGELPERQKAALLMREMAGLGFEEIAAALGTSPATARQTLYEARLSLHEMEAGREMSCDAVTRALSDADGRVTRRRDIRAHLRSCQSCRRFGEEIDSRRHDLAAIAPLPVAAAAGLLHGILGGGTAKALGATAAAKAATAVAVVAVIGVSADRSGLVNLGLPGHKAATPAAEYEGGPSSGATRPGESTGTAAGRQAAARDAAAIRARAKRRAAAHLAAGHGKGRSTAAPVATPTPSGQSGEHPHGRGHAKQHPAASAHGQETAAAHQEAHTGGTTTPAHSSQPVKPVHPAEPAQPVHPVKPATPAPPENSAPAAEAGGENAAEAPRSEGSRAAQPPRPESPREPLGAGPASLP